jgi:hypothetical protein
VSHDRRRTAVRSDGRVRLRVEVPAPVVALADRLVESTGLDREAILGDLAATGLPGVLARLADGAVAGPARRRLGAVMVGNGHAADERKAALVEAADELVGAAARERLAGHRSIDAATPLARASGVASGRLSTTHAERDPTARPDQGASGGDG